MGNRAYIQFQRVIELSDDLSERSGDRRYYGICTYDDFNHSTQLWDSKDEFTKNFDADPDRFAVSVLKLLLNQGDASTGNVLDTIQHYEQGVHINGNYYIWDKIKEAFEDDDEN